MGAPQLAVVHGGETVIPAGQRGGVHVHLHGNVYGFQDFQDKVLEAVQVAERRGRLSLT